jgi:uncharacterized phiE125 gp8 family phage protein
MGLKLITPPPVEPVTLDEAKVHLKCDDIDTENEYISGLIVAAREFAEGHQARAIITQAWEYILDKWPNKDYINLPLPPLQSVESITYTDKNGVESVWPDTNYIVDADRYIGRVALAYNCSWPTIDLYPAGAIRIRFTAGYPPVGEGDTIDYVANVPIATKHAILLMVGHWHTNREPVAIGAVGREIPLSAESLLNLNKVML